MAESYEDVFAPFEQVLIDIPSLVSVEQSLEDQIRKNHSVTSINSENKLVAMSNELFVECRTILRLQSTIGTRFQTGEK